MFRELIILHNIITIREVNVKEFLWWRDGVIYQIYPRSFADTNGNGIGDIEGIRRNLDYLSDLGIDAIWLSPIYPSADIDYGYDISDYKNIHKIFGTMGDFELLLQNAHQRNIHVILDLALNHTSDQHSWFKESKESKDNPYRNYYIWKNPNNKNNLPNNWLSVFGGSAWEYEENSNQYYYHMFFKEQPDLNWRNKKLQKEMCDVFRFWLDKGVDGFRLDVFNVCYKDAQFRDNPKKLFARRPFEKQIHQFDINQSEMVSLLRKIRSILNEYDESYAVGETFLSSAEIAATYCNEDLLHAAFNFEFLNSKWKARNFLKVINRWEKLLGGRSWPNYVLNNHDVTRTGTRYGQGENDERLKVAAALLLTLRGTPFMYYGEEIGMREVRMKHSQILDPVGKYYWPFYRGRDGCRTPMQWSNSQNAGFSSNNPWLPVHKNYKFRNVEMQNKTHNSLLKFYRKLISLRKKYTVFMRGDFHPIEGAPANVMTYSRNLHGFSALVILNFSTQKKRIKIPSLIGKNWRLILSNKRQSMEFNQNNEWIIDGNEACILISKK